MPDASVSGDDRGVKPFKDVVKRKVIDEKIFNGYAAASVIVNSGGDCGKYFGAAAGEALDDLMSRVTFDTLRDNLGNRNEMTGIELIPPASTVQTRGAPPRFASFKSAVFNLAGPYLNPGSQASRDDLGGYRHASLQSQTLQILHELGHVIYGNDGNFLLPPDGANKKTADGKRLLTVANTKTVYDICHREIDALVSGINARR